MDDFSEVINPLGVALATLTPLVKSFFGHMVGRPRALDQRYSRLKTFFDEGATGRQLRPV